MTTVTYRNPATYAETELPFVRWGSRSLVVRRPDGWKHAGREWKLRRIKVLRWLRDGTLRIEGPRPEWAKEQSQ